MVAYTLYDGDSSGVSHAETLSGYAIDIGLTAGRSVQSYVSDNDVFILLEAHASGRIDHQLSAGQALAEIVVAVALQLQGQALRDESSEALSSGSLAFHRKGVLFQAFRIPLCDLGTEHGAEGAVCVAHIQLDAPPASALQRRKQLLEQHLLIESLLQLEIEYLLRIKGHLLAPARIGIVQNRGQIDGCRAALQILLHPQQIRTAYQLIHSAHTETGHVFPQILGNEFHKVHDVFRLAAESFAELRILGRHAYRTGIQVADTHHHAAHGYQRSCGKTELLCAQHGRNRHILAGHQFSVCLDADAPSEAVLDQSLVRLRQSQLPGKACMVDGASGRRARSSIIAGNQDDLGSGLRYAGCYGSHTGLRYQLYGNPRVPVGILQIVDELGQILDGINIVVRRR